MTADRLRPLHEAPLPSLLGVVFDVDDTLTEGGRLRARSIEALERLASAGLVVGIATGRPLGFAEVALRLLPLDFAVGENGAGWFVRDGHRQSAGFFDPDVSGVARRRVEALRIAAEVAPNIPPSDDAWARRVDVAWDVGEHHRADPADVDRLRAALLEAGYRVSISTIHLHAAHAAWDKAHGIARALDTRFDARTVFGRFAFVGDSPNDAEAFAAFACSIGVANVTDLPMATLPRYVARQARSAGVVEIVDAILAARG